MTIKNAQKLSKFLTYALGRRPDEFGLVPDENGYVSVKELLKSLNEEDGWHHIRLAHLNEAALTMVPCPFEIKDKWIRAKDRSRLPTVGRPEKLPKLLYIAVRRRAYPHINEKGIRPGGRSYLILSSDEPMARRIGKRMDNDPVMLTVQVTRSLESGTSFHQYGENLFLADTVFADTFTGPALPKEKPGGDPASKEILPTRPKTPGSYFPELSPPEKPKRSRRKEVEWKKNRRLARKHKSRR